MGRKFLDIVNRLGGPAAVRAMQARTYRPVNGG